MKKFIYESYGYVSLHRAKGQAIKTLADTIEFAESLGWVDKDDSWNDTMDDGRVLEAIEQDAIDYIESQGYEVIMDDE